jgi:adhesin transport system membrane fusion protein
MSMRRHITSSTDVLSSTHAPSLSRRDPWARLGFATIALVCMAIWAVTRSFNAPETFVVSGTIQDLGESIPVKVPDGAKVSRLLVRNGDRVSAGQPLAHIDDADIRRDFEAASTRVTDLLISEQRILAQRDKTQSLTLPAGIDLTDPATAKLFSEHRDMLAKSLASASEEKASLRDMLKRTQSEAADVAKQLAARLKERDLNERELANSQPLFERSSVNRLRFGQLERESIRIGTDIAKLRAETAKIKATRADLEARLARADIDISQSAVPELDRVRDLLMDAAEARNNLAARLELSKILSPTSGVVRGIKDTDESVRKSPDPELMRISSGNETIVIETTVASDQVGKLNVGTIVSVEFLSSTDGQTDTVRVPISEIGGAHAKSSTSSAISAVPIKISIPHSQIQNLEKEPRWPADKSVKIVFGSRSYPTLAEVTRPLGDGLAFAFDAVSPGTPLATDQFHH